MGERERGEGERARDIRCLSPTHPVKTMERESGGDSAAELGSVSEELMVLASQTRVCRAFEVAEDSVVEEFDEQYRSVFLHPSSSETSTHPPQFMYSGAPLLVSPEIGHLSKEDTFSIPKYIQSWMHFSH